MLRVLQREEQASVLAGKTSESEVAQSCPTLCDPMDCSPPRSSVHGFFHVRTLEWVAISFSRGSSQPRDLGEKRDFYIRSPSSKPQAVTLKAWWPHSYAGGRDRVSTWMAEELKQLRTNISRRLGTLANQQ
ncbi:unnamed protein product [Rangifer tarandus platyrhynchus]|uniref:Uncharacterized protein n=2 Tax=Rangifer tarandus platyrhynchus TaxID=3082113 RepID=A0ACB1ML61_RANTA|nr:unnamed protein product [Rangifer tarandus platyrhynchus]